MIRLKDVKRSYGERIVLDVGELTVGDGEVLAVAGANGCGKTTLLKVLAGQLRPDRGEIELPGRVLYMPQRPYAFRGDLIDNIMLGGGEKQRAEELLEKLGLERLRDKKARSLSGGELQRLSLCRVLYRKADVLLLDEPTSACDAEGARLAIEAIDAYRIQNGCTVIMSTHAPALAVNAADRLIVMSDGRIVADGIPYEVLEAPQDEWIKSFIAGWRISK